MRFEKGLKCDLKNIFKPSISYPDAIQLEKKDVILPLERFMFYGCVGC